MRRSSAVESLAVDSLAIESTIGLLERCRCLVLSYDYLE